MKHPRRVVLVAVLLAGIGILTMSRRPSFRSENDLPLPEPDEAQVRRQPTTPRSLAGINHGSTPKRPAPAIDPVALAALSSNKSYRLVHSNVVIQAVMVPGPSWRSIGSPEFEEMSKRDFDDVSVVEPTMIRLKDMLEADGVPEERLYSAIRVVYEMRSTQLGLKQMEFEDKRSLNDALARLREDTIHSESDKALIRQERIDIADAEELARVVDVKDLVERVKAKLQILVGGVSEATFERFYSLEPRLHAGALRP